MSDRARVWLTLIGLNVLWGPVNLCVATAQQDLSTGAIAFARWSLFALLTWTLYLKHRSFVLPKGKMMWLAIAIGLLCVAPSHAMYYTGIGMSSSSETTVLNTTSPLWTGLLAWLIAGEKPTWKRILAIILGAVGSYVVVIGFGPPTFDRSHALGNVIYLGGVFAEALAMVLALKVIRASSGRGTLAFELIGITAGFLLFSKIFPAQLEMTQISGSISVWTVLAIAYLVVIAGVLSWGTWYRIAERVPVSMMVVSLGVQAPVGVLLGYFMRGETIGAGLIQGGLMILIALFLAASEKPPESANSITS